jgi:hypothetical protein
MTRQTIFILALALTPVLAFSQTNKTPKVFPPATRATDAANRATDATPIAKNMKEYAKTPQGLKRIQKLGKSFAPTTNGAATKDIKYPDGSTLHLTMVRNPTFADQSTSIQAKVKSDKEKPKHSNDANGSTWDCSVDHVQLTAQSTTFMNNDYSAQASHIYPGACYTFDNFYNGSYLEQTGVRNPITIMTDNPNVKGSPSRVVQNPNMATCRAALDDLFREATGPAATESMSTQFYENSNDADQSLKISGGASGYGISLSASYATGSQSNTLNLTIDAIKTVFSINTIPPDSGFFKDPNIEATPHLMVMGSVSYGIRILANVTATFNSEQEAAAFKASYSGFGVNANINLDQLSKEKSLSETINCYVVGGTGKSTFAFNKKDLEKQVQSILAGATYKNAMPVRYEFYDMAGEVVGSSSATDDFAVRECTPGNNDPRLESVFVTFQTGGDNKNQDDDYIMYLYPGSVNQQLTPSLLGVTLFNLMSAVDNWLNYIAGGSVFGFGTGPNSPEYPQSTSTTVEMYKQNRAVTLSEFTSKGGSLRLHLEPHNTDTWDISAIQVTLQFSGTTAQTQKIQFTGFAPMSNDHTELLLYFGTDFKQR